MTCHDCARDARTGPFRRVPGSLAVFACGVTLCLVAVGAWAANEASDRPAETDSIAVTVPVVEVTALRGRDLLRDIPAAAFVIDRATLARSGAGRVTTALSRLPGFHAYRQTGSGEPSVIDPRGFTANGESSYLKLLVNGQDVRDVENGNVDWDWVGADDVERIEVIGGSGSWLYGDGSEGGVVNVVRPELQSEGVRPDCAARVGSHGLATASLVLSTRRAQSDAALRGSMRRAEGFRDRSEESAYGGGAAFGWRWNELVRAGLDVSVLDTRREDPGSLTREQLREDRAQSETATDYAHSRRIMVGGRVVRQSRAGDVFGRPDVELRFAPYVRHEETDQVRTIFFVPEAHPTAALTTGAELTWRRSFWGPDFIRRPRKTDVIMQRIKGSPRVVVDAGINAEHSRFTSRYENYASGEIETRTEADRLTGAAHAGARITLDSRTTARLGLRADAIRVGPVEHMGSPEIEARTLSAVSPFVALSRTLGRAATLYANFSTGFRVPTLNQLFDARPIYNPFIDQVIFISNAGLAPQRSRGFEVGARCDRRDGSWASLSAYTVRVRDEIDFDLATISYANLGRSRHEGIQLAVWQTLGATLALSANGAWMPTTIVGGENDGNQINAVPEGTAYGAVVWTPDPRGSVEAGVRYTGRQFLDKANEHALADFATAEVSASVRVARVRSTVRVANLFDREYEDSGFLGALGEERFLPASGRTFSLALTFD